MFSFRFAFAFSILSGLSGCTASDAQIFSDAFNAYADASWDATMRGSGSGGGSPCDQAPGAGYICR